MVSGDSQQYVPGMICFVWLAKEIKGVISNQVLLLVSLEFF